MPQRAFKFKHEKQIILKTDHALIELSNGKFAKVDLSDVALVSAHNWHTVRDCACAMIRGKRIFMHNFLLCGLGEAKRVKHKNGDNLDNRRCNLTFETDRRERKCVLCDKPSQSRGYCYGHYRKFLYYGDPLISFKRDNKLVIHDGYATIETKKGEIVMIDIEDVEQVNTRRWQLDGSGGYPCVHINNKTIRIHNFLLGKPSKGFVVDHINGDRLDNRRSNLRVVTVYQNAANTSRPKGVGNPYRGVTFLKDKQLWRAIICYQRRAYHLGTFLSSAEAALAYDKKARELHGEYARVNFPEQDEAA